MQTLSNDLKVTVTNRQIFQIALPISASLVIPNINFLTNSIFLGGLGMKELGNAGITGVYYLVLMFAGSGFSNALQAIIARQGGEGRKDEIHKVFAQGQRTMLWFSLGGILFTWFIAPFILKNFVRAEDYTQEINFLKIRVFGLPFLYMFQAGNAFLLGTLNSRYLLVGAIGQSLLNIFLDYSFIYGNFYFPKLGFNGAAVASVIAEISGMVIVYIVIFKMGLKDKFHLFKNFRYDKTYSKIVVNISAPLVLQFILSTVTWLIFFILLEQYGEQAKAISNAMRNVFSFTGVLTWAFASTSNIMVSNLIGQGSYNKVTIVIKKIMWLSVITTCGLLSILNIYSHYFLRLFGQDEVFINAALPVMRVVSVGMLMMSIATTWLYAVTGTGRTKMNLLIEIIATILYLLFTLSMIKTFHLSLAYAWSNEFFYWLIVFSISFWFIKKGGWQKHVQVI